MKLDTINTIYICTDGKNGEVKVLLPKDCKLELVELKLDEPDPHSPSAKDKHEFGLLRDEMVETTYDL